MIKILIVKDLIKFNEHLPDYPLHNNDNCM